MKQCPLCRRTYTDETLSFCLEDGTPLVAPNASKITLEYVPAATERFEVPRNSPPNAFQVSPFVGQPPPRRSKFWIIPTVIGLLLLIAVGGVAALLLLKNKSGSASDSNLRPVVSNASVNTTANADVAKKPAPSPSPTVEKPPSRQLVGTWESDVVEQGVKTHITYVLNADGTSKAFFKTSRGQTGKDHGTWQFSDDVLYETFSNAVSAKGAIRMIDEDTFEITIIDNGTPAYSGLKRIYHRKR